MHVTVILKLCTCRYMYMCINNYHLQCIYNVQYVLHVHVHVYTCMSVYTIESVQFVRTACVM